MTVQQAGLSQTDHYQRLGENHFLHYVAKGREKQETQTKDKERTKFKIEKKEKEKRKKKKSELHNNLINEIPSKY